LQYAFTILQIAPDNLCCALFKCVGFVVLDRAAVVAPAQWREGTCPYAAPCLAMQWPYATQQWNKLISSLSHKPCEFEIVTVVLVESMRA
jgi:hypothetical protein